MKLKQHTFSICIPTYKRRDKLRACLDSLVKQDYPKNKYEVIVSDDSSDDGTKEMLETAYPDVILIENNHEGVIPALNAGMAKAKNEILVYLMDDNIAEPAFLSEVNKAFSNPEVNVIGTIQKPVKDNIIARYEWFMVQYNVKRGAVGPPFAFRREVWDAIGGLDRSKRYSEDVNFVERVRAKGYKVVQTQIIVQHNRKYTLQEFTAQMKYRGKSGVEGQGKAHMVVKIVLFPFLMVKYWFELGNPEIWVMHCFYSLGTSVYGILE